MEKFNAVSMKIPKKAIDYSIVVYDTLYIMMEELLSDLRRRQRFAILMRSKGPSTVLVL